MEEKSIIWTRRASVQFENTQEYIASDNPEAADDFVDKVLHLVDGLLKYPQIGRMIPEYGNPIFRERIHGHYRIMYHLDNDEIRILALYHDAQLMPKEL